MLFRSEFEVSYAYLFDHYKMGAIAWGPQAGGLLSGGYNDGTIPVSSRFNIMPFLKKTKYDEYIG
jgi:Predicted oxidoreductases (related to aryl-alcohol dehydrogenases)